MTHLTREERLLRPINHEPADDLPVRAFKVEPCFVRAWEERLIVKVPSRGFGGA
ncbi:MAG: hypothetical protein Kow0069_09150 [Promethearchaeota archaeon]